MRCWVHGEVLSCGRSGAYGNLQITLCSYIMFISKAGVSQEQEEGDGCSFTLAQHIAGHKTSLWSSVSAEYSSVSSSSQEMGEKATKNGCKTFLIIFRCKNKNNLKKKFSYCGIEINQGLCPL